MDEQDLRSGLRALTREAPPAPPARAEGAVRRSVRIRRTRAAASLVVVAALAAPVTLVLADGGERAARPTSAGVGGWPDRREDGLADRYDEAVRQYAREVRPPGAGETVRPLYSGVVPGANSVAVAFAYCGPDTCSRAVLGTTDSDVGYGPQTPQEVPWVWVTREVRDGALSAPLASLVAAEPNLDDRRGSQNVVLVVAPPGAYEGTWSSEGRAGVGASQGPLVERDRAFFAMVGFVSGPVTVRLVDARGQALAEGLVGDLDSPSGVGNGALPNPPAAPDPTKAHHSVASQIGPRESATWEQPFPGGRYTVVARCDGAQPMRVSGPGLLGLAPCDGRPHRFDATTPAPAGKLAITVSSKDPYTTYAFVIATP
jgi:hypothetical protein